MASMAKKKNQGKKHKFKYAAESSQVQVATSHPQPGTQPQPNSDAVPALGKSSARAGVAVATAGRDFSYVGKDLKRIIILMAALVVLEFALWGLMSRTGLGSWVQDLIKV
jgi:hypothetical protein